jgi:predicted metal-dependent phosphoesterase TrpH
MSAFLKRREFIASSSAFAAVAGLPAATSETAHDRWYRGNLHMHTLLSDGQAFPDEAARLYRKMGYDFVVFSDHNKVHEGANVWVDARNRKSFKPENVANFKKHFPDSSLESRISADGTVSYRLKTFDELSRELNEPGRFLIVSGCEYHNVVESGHALHCNGINVRTERRHKNTASLTEAIENILSEHYAANPPSKAKTLFTVNHPFWYHYDIDPMFLADHAEVRFFEIANAISPPAFGMMEGAWSPDRFWDIALAHRAARGAPLLYAVATDDTHNYSRFYREFEGIKNPIRKCHVRVRAKELSVDALIDAMYAGDFYASNGLEFNDIRFDRSSGTLAVDVKPSPGKRIVIRFYGTKKGFDETIGDGREYRLEDLAAQKGKELPKWLEGKCRTFREFSDDIGVVLKEVKGTKASYTLQNDDLYVRAKAFVLTKPGNEDTIPHYTDVAWTQPYRK